MTSTSFHHPMVVKPNLADGAIVACLRETYGVSAIDLEFLPLGKDSAAGVYRVDTAGGETYFLKVRKGPVDPVSVELPRYLNDCGITQIVAPLQPVVAGRAWGTAHDYALILYPFVSGRVAANVDLCASQWVEYGAIFRGLHAVPISAAIRQRIPREAFVSSWRQGVERLQTSLAASREADSRSRELAAIWNAHRDQIDWIVRQMKLLAESLRERQLGLVICHTDLHLVNVMVDPAGRLFAVDWDAPLLAPKERDLHFVIQSKIVGRVPIGPAQEDLIFRGYGPAELDWPALVYFRLEWVCGDLYEYGEEARGNRGSGDPDRDAALRTSWAMFEPGNSVASAVELIQRAPHGTLPFP